MSPPVTFLTTIVALVRDAAHKGLLSKPSLYSKLLHTCKNCLLLGCCEADANLLLIHIVAYLYCLLYQSAARPVKSELACV